MTETNFFEWRPTARILGSGGRDYDNYDEVQSALDSLHATFDIEAIAQGGAHGADALIKRWCSENGFVEGEKSFTYPAAWNEPCTNACHHAPRRFVNGRTERCPAAGPRRNRSMFHSFKPNVGLIFPGGRGTADMKAILVTKHIRTYDGETMERIDLDQNLPPLDTLFGDV